MAVACGIFMVLWAFVIAVAYALRWAGAPDVVKASSAGVCAGCGYSLAGLTGTRCPECGGEAAAARLLQPSERRASWAVAWVFIACLVAHAPGVVLCELKSTYFDPLYTTVIFIAVCHAVVAAIAVGIVSLRGSRWLTVLTGSLLAGSVFALEFCSLWATLASPSTSRVDAEYAGLTAWLWLAMAVVASGIVFVLVMAVVAVYLWWRGPELVIAPVEKGPTYPFRPKNGSAGKETGVDAQS